MYVKCGKSKFVTCLRAVVNGTTALHSIFLKPPLYSLFFCLQIYYSPEPVKDFEVLSRVEGASLLKGCNEVLTNWKQAGHLSSKARRQGRTFTVLTSALDPFNIVFS